MYVSPGTIISSVPSPSMSAIVKEPKPGSDRPAEGVSPLVVGPQLLKQSYKLK